MITFKRLYKYVLVGVIGAISFAGLADLGASIETRFLPVLRNQAVYGGHWRIDREFCWTWAALKARTGEPEDFTSILVRLPDGRNAILPVYRGDENRPIEPGLAKAPGDHFAAQLCSVMPLWVSPATPFDIVGDVEYRRPHRLWSVKHAIPVLEWRPR